MSLTRQVEMLNPILNVLRAAQAVEPLPGDCSDLHVDFGNGLTVTQYDHMEAGCAGRCICGKPIKTMVFRGTGYCSQACERAPF